MSRTGGPFATGGGKLFEPPAQSCFAVNCLQSAAAGSRSGPPPRLARGGDYHDAHDASGGLLVHAFTCGVQLRVTVPRLLAPNRVPSGYPDPVDSSQDHTNSAPAPTPRCCGTCAGLRASMTGQHCIASFTAGYARTRSTLGNQCRHKVQICIKC